VKGCKIHHSTTPEKTLSVDPVFFVFTLAPANVGYIQGKLSDAPAKKGLYVDSLLIELIPHIDLQTMYPFGCLFLLIGYCSFRCVCPMHWQED